MVTEADDRSAEVLALRQQLEQARADIRRVERLAERPDPWDPKVWYHRARRAAGMAKRAAVRVRNGRAAPPVAHDVAPSSAPSAFPAWLKRMEGSRYVGFPIDWRFIREPLRTPADVAVVLHCHFPDLLDDLLSDLAAIPVPFDLYVTNSSGEALDTARIAAAGAQHTEVLTVENHGRDIWPLVQVINAGILDGYDYVLKVHTKKSAWREQHAELAGDGAGWRADLTAALLGSSDNVSAILGAMAADPDVAAITADGSVVGPEHWGGDLALTQDILRRLSMPLDPDTLRFPAGSMYWIRGFVLQGLRAFRFDRDDFEEEAGQIDGTAAHAIERMIGILSAEAGMRVLERSDVEAAPLEALRPTTPTARVIPFYLPQFHKVPQNDRWWGEGFTEWYNVAKAEPIFDGHVVPLRPTELGYYDLEMDVIRERQRDLSVAHGIEGFMYYHYWFAGERLLHEPLDRLVASDLEQPFCIMWANENWTRRWDGGDTDMLIGQHYDEVPAEAFIEHALPMLADPRYLRVGGAPVLAVYKLAQFPDPAAAVARWRERAREEGIGELHVLSVDVGANMGGLGAAEIAEIADGTLMFAPHNLPWVISEVAAAPKDDRFTGNMMSYRATAVSEVERLGAGISTTAHPGLMVTFDNTARRQWRPDMFTGSNPYTFRRWLRACALAVQDREPDERLVFLNAWNEWAESAVLEPTEQFGRTYLLACRSAVLT